MLTSLSPDVIACNLMLLLYPGRNVGYDFFGNQLCAANGLTYCEAGSEYTGIDLAIVKQFCVAMSLNDVLHDFSIVLLFGLLLTEVNRPICNKDKYPS